MLDQEFPQPIAVPLKFDLAQSPFTDQGSNRLSGRFMGFGPLWWITLAPESLVIGKANAPGIWVIPRSDIDAKEQAGLDAVMRVLAGKLVEGFDADKDGQIDRAEFAALQGDKPNVGFSVANGFMQFDTNRDGKLAPEELASYLQQETRRSFRARMPATPSFNRMAYRGNSPEAFKEDVENFWRTTARTNALPPIRKSPGAPAVLPSDIRPPVNP